MSTLHSLLTSYICKFSGLKFDLFMYISEGGGIKDLLGSYNFLTGNLWILVVITTFISPIVVSKIKKRKGEIKNV